MKILKLFFRSSRKYYPVRVAIYSLQSLVSSFSVVQQDSFSLKAYMQCITFSGSTFVCTFDAGTHKMSGSEGYMEDLQHQEGCKNVD
jgi:hypothetical protein